MMNKPLFTFGVFAYNQEKEVVQTLNSIKYQIITFGRNFICNLIITDDCSKDNTVKNIDYWIENNSELFCRIVKRYNAENKGTVDNYHFILDKIGSEPFKIIAGDDLISGNNIFDTFKNVGKHTLYTGYRVFFSEECGVYDSDKYAYLQFYMNNKKMNKKQLIKLFKMGHIISTPQTLYHKRLYDESQANDLNSQFRIFEDNPTWYAMFKNIDDLEVVFSTNNLVLYRISEKAISRGSAIKPAFKEELDRLYSIYLLDSDFIEKLYFKSIIKNLPKFINFSKYANEWLFFKCKVYSLIHKNEYLEFERQIKKQLKDGISHYQRIISM